MRIVIVALLCLLPVSSFASHTSRSIDRSWLDDDIVETFPVPVLFGVTYDDVVSDYGAPRGGGTRSHEGQDFIAPQGTPIVTPTEAIVIETGTWSGGGKYVQTANPGGETFRYMHLHEWADLDRGDRLHAGDYIGTIGDTGNAAPGQYHLHFEVLDADRQPQDPYPRLTTEFSLPDQIDFLDDIFKSRRDDSDYAQFLVETFPSEFRQAVAEDIDLPRAVEGVVEELGWAEQRDTIDQITALKAQVKRLQLQLQILLLQQRLASLQG